MSDIVRDLNPFRAAGLPDADPLLLKQRAVEFLRGQLEQTRMSQAELARQAGLESSHASEMLTCRLTRFGLDRLNRALAVFGAEIRTRYEFQSIV